MTAVQGAVVSAGGLQAYTDANGRYTLNGLNPGQMDVTLTAAGFDPMQVTVTIVSGATTTQNFVLMAGSAAMTGSVTDADTGDPLAAIVRAGNLSTQTADDGSYTLSGIPAGQSNVSASAKGHQTEHTMVQFTAQQTIQMDFSLPSTHKRPGRPQVQVQKARAGR
jgi:hypothetical protein